MILHNTLPYNVCIVYHHTVHTMDRIAYKLVANNHHRYAKVHTYNPQFQNYKYPHQNNHLDIVFSVHMNIQLNHLYMKYNVLVYKHYNLNLYNHHHKSKHHFFYHNNQMLYQYNNTIFIDVYKIYKYLLDICYVYYVLGSGYIAVVSNK